MLLSMKHEIPAMLRSGGGAIVNNSSIGGHIGFNGSSVYVASKFAVIGLTKTAALEFAKQGVRVNSVSPESTTMKDVTEPLPDPHTGGTSFVRAAAAQLADTRPFDEPGHTRIVAAVFGYRDTLTARTMPAAHLQDPEGHGVRRIGVVFERLRQQPHTMNGNGIRM